MNSERKIRIRNLGSELKAMWLEPWGEDYWLRPDEEVDVIAKGVDQAFYFQVDFGQQIVVWAEGTETDIGVYGSGTLLNCGYQRVEEAK